VRTLCLSAAGFAALAIVFGAADWIAVAGIGVSAFAWWLTDEDERR
jgi:type IV secretory pathway TrbD component